METRSRKRQAIQSMTDDSKPETGFGKWNALIDAAHTPTKLESAFDLISLMCTDFVALVNSNVMAAMLRVFDTNVSPTPLVFAALRVMQKLMDISEARCRFLLKLMQNDSFTDLLNRWVMYLSDCPPTYDATLLFHVLMKLVVKIHSRIENSSIVNGAVSGWKRDLILSNPSQFLQVTRFLEPSVCLTVQLSAVQMLTSWITAEYTPTKIMVISNMQYFYMNNNLFRLVLGVVQQALTSSFSGLETCAITLLQLMTPDDVAVKMQMVHTGILAEVCELLPVCSNVFPVIHKVCVNCPLAQTAINEYDVLQHGIKRFEEISIDNKERLRQTIKTLYQMCGNVSSLRQQVCACFTSTCIKKLVSIVFEHDGTLNNYVIGILLSGIKHYEQPVVRTLSSFASVFCDAMRAPNAECSVLAKRAVACLLNFIITSCPPERRTCLHANVIASLVEFIKFASKTEHVSSVEMGLLLMNNLVTVSPDTVSRVSVKQAYEAGFIEFAEASLQCPEFKSHRRLVVILLAMSDRTHVHENVVPSHATFVEDLMRHALTQNCKSVKAMFKTLLDRLLTPDEFKVCRSFVINTLLGAVHRLFKFPDNQKMCTICTGGDEDGEVVYAPCFHAYHVSCLKEWLVVKDSCPLCATPVLRNLVNPCGVPRSLDKSTDSCTVCM